MTHNERLIIANQFAILEFLTRAHPEIATCGNSTYHDPETYSWYQSILAHGHDILLEEITQHIYDVKLSRQEQEDVLETLNMWRHLQRSFNDLEDKQDLTSDDVKFPGWDGHRNELSFARLYCYREESRRSTETSPVPDRFDDVEPSPAYDSHMPTMDMYYRMLEVYKPIKEVILNRAGFRPLTYDEIKTVLAARTHPDYQK